MDISALRVSVQRLLGHVASFADADFAEPSALPGWSRGHVLTHLARAADSRTRLLVAARDGRVGQQYPSEDSRAAEIEAGAGRAAAEIRVDLEAAFERFLDAVREHPADGWERPGEWLGVGPRPVRRTVPSLRREVEYHHVDLAAGYQPWDWPEDFVAEQLAHVARLMDGRPEAPALTLVAPDRTLHVHAGGRRVAGSEVDLLAWLTGRGPGEGLQTEPPGPLPPLPDLS